MELLARHISVFQRCRGLPNTYRNLRGHLYAAATAGPPPKPDALASRCALIEQLEGLKLSYPAGEPGIAGLKVE